MAYTVLEEKWEDNYYLKLQSDFESELSLADINGAVLQESFNFNSPMFIIRFMDAIGDLISHNRISPDADYRLISGKNERESIAYDYSLSKNSFQNTSVTSAENVFSQIYFISSQWKELIGRKKFRSWNQVRYSDVVEEIVQNLGIEDYDIEVTQGVFNVIQPGWTDYQLMEWMRNRSTNQQGIAGYESGFTADGRFIFRTIHSMTNARPIRSFYLAEENRQNLEDYIFNFEIIQDYADLVKQGASGYSYGYYDYMNKEYVKGETLPSDTDQRQLSDWTFVAESHEGPDNFIDGGRSSDVERYTQNRVLSAANSIQKVKIDVKGDMTIHIGDVVKLYMATSVHSKLPINEYYSGHYIVSKVSHEFNFQGRGFITKLQLSRQGVNGSDIQGFVESNTGKEIRS